MYGEEEEAYRLLVGKPMRKKPLGNTRRRWEDNNKKNLKDIGWELVGWIRLPQDTDRWRVLVNTVQDF
jgi:hypothetical protein